MPLHSPYPAKIMEHKTEVPTFLRYNDLKARRIFQNRTTLRRWLAAGLFPQPILLGPNSLAWKQSDVEEWIAQRAKLPPVGSGRRDKRSARENPTAKTDRRGSSAATAIRK